MICKSKYDPLEQMIRSCLLESNALPGKGYSVSRDYFYHIYHIWNTMLIYIKLCTHIGRIDVEVAETPQMLPRSQFILENPLYIMTLTVSAHLKS
jgi:hypothetical protein